jgi:hypothetical protein
MYQHTTRDADLVTDVTLSTEEQLVILRRRIRDFEFRIKELEPEGWKGTDARLLLSLQAQVQEDRKKLRDLTGEL